jgi:hypothetical protein
MHDCITWRSILISIHGAWLAVSHCDINSWCYAWFHYTVIHHTFTTWCLTSCWPLRNHDIINGCETLLSIIVSIHGAWLAVSHSDIDSWFYTWFNYTVIHRSVNAWCLNGCWPWRYKDIVNGCETLLSITIAIIGAWLAVCHSDIDFRWYTRFNSTVIHRNSNAWCLTSCWPWRCTSMIW